jgi:cytosine/adenosine deaminase-related metal-dependent hydrolase
MTLADLIFTRKVVMLMQERIEVKAGIAFVDDLKLRRNVCIHIRDGIIESIESFSSCSSKYIGGERVVVTPQPANAHIHSADFSFPEYATEASLEEAVAEPYGVKHRLLSTLSDDMIIGAIKKVYEYSWRIGVGLLVDFREGGGKGCEQAKKAIEKLKGKDIIIKVLGRPGPQWPVGCDGLGLSTVFSVKHAELRELLATYRPAHVHVSETQKLRESDDFLIAVNEGFDALVHGTYLMKEDLYLIKKKDLTLILCPRSNMWHSLKKPPLKELYNLKIKIAIGTDNAGLIKPDIWREAETLLFLFRLQGIKDPGLPKYILEALFINGYNTVFLKPRIISEGDEAHLLIFDGETPGVINAINTYYAVVKRLSGEHLLFRIDKEKVFKIT